MLRWRWNAPQSCQVRTAVKYKFFGCMLDVMSPTGPGAVLPPMPSGPAYSILGKAGPIAP